MSKERITAYLTSKANKHELSFTDIPKLTELIEGYLNQSVLRGCGICKNESTNAFHEPCISCDNTFSNFKPKE